MEPEEVILMDGFTLMDAMSAFEVSQYTGVLGCWTDILYATYRSVSRAWIVA